LDFIIDSNVAFIFKMIDRDVIAFGLLQLQMSKKLTSQTIANNTIFFYHQI